MKSVFDLKNDLSRKFGARVFYNKTKYPTESTEVESVTLNLHSTHVIVRFSDLHIPDAYIYPHEYNSKTGIYENRDFSIQFFNSRYTG